MMGEFAVILPAAGSSSRFGGPRNKLLEPLGGISVIARAMQAFLQRDDVAAIIVPTQASTDLLAQADDALRRCMNDRRVGRCVGGGCRAESVRAALMQVPERIEWVAVHDAARPLISQALIDRTLAAAIQHGAAVPAMPVHLTIKQAPGPLPARVQRTVPRHELWAMQTPQMMRRTELLAAFASCPMPLEQVTDDVQLLELAGKDVYLVGGEERNLKVTTPMDLKIAELYLHVE
jgi:2-C-methyl-D-erythritol 4-phosphate cytidylyltransferase